MVKCHKRLFFLAALLIYGPLLSGQCPDRGALRAHILDMRDLHPIAPALQLSDLTPTVALMQRCGYTRDTVYALLLQRIGALYGATADYTKACQFTHAAIGVLNGRKQDESGRKLLAKCYYNLSIYYNTLKRIPEKNNAIDSFLLVMIPASPDFLTLYVLSRRVDYLFNAGDYLRCVHFADMAAGIGLPDTGKVQTLQLGILSNKLNALLFLKQYDEANDALHGREMEFIRSGNPIHIANLYSFQGDIAKGLRNYPMALRHFRDALAVQQQARHPQGCVQVLNDIGFLYLSNFKAPATALQYFQKALGYRDSIESLNVLDNMAVACMQMGKYQQALIYFRLALDQLSPGLREEQLPAYALSQERNVVAYLVELMLNKGDALLSIGRMRGNRSMLQQAIELYAITDRLLDSVRNGQAETESKLFWRADNHRLYDRAIQACYAAGKREEAFYFFEKSRAVLLQDRLIELRQASQDDLLQQARLTRSIQTLQDTLTNTAGSSAAFHELQEKIFTARQGLRRLTEHLRSPVLPQSSDSGVAGLGAIRARLYREGFSLLEFFAGDSALYVLSINGTRTRMDMIPKVLYDSLSADYTMGLVNSSPTREVYARHRSAAAHLYRLFFPDESMLAKRVIISPDGHYFPFESLAKDTGNAAVHFFIEDHAVTYTYSMQYLAYTHEGSTEGRAFLGIAPVTYARYQGLPALEGSDRSMRTLLSYFPDGEQYAGDRGSLHNFLQNFYKYQVLQLYTHASSQAGKGHPMIYFADSALAISDLVPGQHPSTRLVVLSACETAVGEFHPGEGVFSFSREFAALGIPASIANLWSVDNQATYRQTELFYKYLTTGSPVDIALQQAKKEFLRNADREQRLPYYWAAPILTGQTSIRLEKVSRYEWLTDLLIIAVILLAIYIILRGSRRRRNHYIAVK